MKFLIDFLKSKAMAFAAGVLISYAFNFLMYKDHTRITAPGLAALTAFCTFSLALYTASKVKEWLDVKINDTAFRQTEKIMNIIENSHEDIDPLYREFSDINKDEKMYAEVGFTFNEEYVERLDSITRKADNFCNRLTMSANMLTYLNSNLTKEGNKNLFEMIFDIREINIKIKNIADYPINASRKLDEIKVHFSKVFASLNFLIQSPYANIFEHGKKNE